MSKSALRFAPARSYAMAFHSLIAWRCAAPDNLPQLPQLAFEKLGQRKPNKHAMPQLPQPAPTVFNKNRTGKARRGVRDVRAENYIRATKPGLCNPSVQLCKVLPGVLSHG